MLNGYIGLAADTKVGMQAMDVSEEVKSEDHGAIRAVLKRHHASACRARLDCSKDVGDSGMWSERGGGGGESGECGLEVGEWRFGEGVGDEGMTQ
jgi:hypothetical protein